MKTTRIKRNTIRHNLYTGCWWVLVLTISFSLDSCQNQINKNDEASFEKVLARADAALGLDSMRYTRSGINEVESAYKSIEQPGIKLTAEWYYRKTLYYWGCSIPAYDSINMYADSIIFLLADNCDNKRLAKIYAAGLFTKGGIRFKQKSYDAAIHYYTLGKIVLSSRQPVDTALLFDYYDCMSFVMYQQKKYLLAAEFFREKYNLAPFAKSTPLGAYVACQENLSNIGMCYYNAAMPDSALYYYDLALDYITTKSPKFPEATPVSIEYQKGIIYRNRADVLYLQKKYAAAAALYTIALQKTKPLGTDYAEPVSLSLANVYLDLHRPKDAGTILGSIALQTDSAAISKNAEYLNKLLSDYWMAAGMPEKANDYLLRAVAIHDSLEKRDHSFNTTDIKNEVETVEQKSSNDLLKKAISTKADYLLAAVTGLCLAVIIIVLIGRSLTQKANFVKELLTLNTTIEEKNQALQITLASLEQSHADSNRITRAMAHDLKNPINAVRTLIRSLIRKDLPDNKREVLGLIESTCGDSIVLINDLLNRKRRLADVSKELVDIGRLIEQCTELFQGKAGEKKQQLRLEIHHPLVQMDRQRIWRVISNIVNNAIKFSPEETEILIKLEQKDNTVVLSVHDNGIGIPATLKDLIFTLNPLVSREGTAGETSYGMGLSISRKIVEEHKGKLWFESEDGAGSVFFVELPAELAHA